MKIKQPIYFFITLFILLNSTLFVSAEGQKKLSNLHELKNNNEELGTQQDNNTLLYKVYGVGAGAAAIPASGFCLMMSFVNLHNLLTSRREITITDLFFNIESCILAGTAIYTTKKMFEDPKKLDSQTKK